AEKITIHHYSPVTDKLYQSRQMNKLKAKNGNLQEFYVVPRRKQIDDPWKIPTSSVLTIPQMAVTTSISSPSLSPLLFSKTHHTYFPRLDEHPNFCKFDRCCLQTVSSRQNPLCLSSSGTWVLNASLVRAEASGNGREPMVPPYNVLITGYALAKEFLKAGDNGTTCDVREGQDVKDLVSFAQKELKYIDIWINNAGSNAYSFKPLSEASDEDLIEVVTTNALGLMLCCREAIKMMLNQPRGGHIFNIDGAGSDGRPTPRFAAYGATKRSAVHLTKSLQAELQMQDVKNVAMHNLSPGMVTTDLLMSGATTKQAKFFINVLAEPPEVVAEYLVPNIRSVPANGSMKPTYIRFLTG
ncbi:NYC1-like protein, partial [Prunus dulcis]